MTPKFKWNIHKTHSQTPQSLSLSLSLSPAPWPEGGKNDAQIPSLSSFEGAGAYLTANSHSIIHIHILCGRPRVRVCERMREERERKKERKKREKREAEWGREKEEKSKGEGREEESWLACLFGSTKVPIQMIHNHLWGIQITHAPTEILLILLSHILIHTHSLSLIHTLSHNLSHTL